MLFILILIISLAAQFFLPWWIIAPIAFLLSLRLGESAKKSFWNGFSALFLLWTCMALLHTLPNENLLANRVAQVIGLPDSQFSWIVLIIISSTLGALVAGVSAFAGFEFKKAFLNRK